MAEDFKDLPEAEVRRKNISIVWAIPLIALVIGLWTIHQNQSKKGVPITIIFENGQGIAPDKTLIKYSGVPVGTVKKVKLDQYTKKVIVNAVIKKEYIRFVKENTLFWLVKPRIEVGGVSGVETILTGIYITLRPGNGETSFNFKALENPPPSDPDSPGLHLVLKSSDLGSLVAGSPVLFKKIKVGKIESNALTKDGKNVLIHILINSQYSHLVKKNTRFWNVSGIEVKGDLGGIEVKAASLSSVIDGGITFETPDFEDLKPHAENQDEFILYKNKDSAMERGFPIKIFFDSAEGIEPGTTPLKYKGMAIGKVTELNILKDSGRISATILVNEKAKAIASKGSIFWLVKPRLDLKGISGLNTIISGQYIEVRPVVGNETIIEFEALKSPPLTDPEAPGLHIIVKSKNLNSISEGSPVYTKGIEAGRVEGYAITNSGVDISIHIYEKYSDLINPCTRFYNESGISVSGDLSGINVNTGSLESLIIGGISFETPAHECSSKGLGNEFLLFESREKALLAGSKIKLYFDNALGLKKGITPVKYKGIEIGKITDISLNPDNGVTAEISLYSGSPEIAKSGSIFHLVKPELGLDKLSGVETLLTGSYINVFIGKGPLQTEFSANKGPILNHLDIQGIKIKLKSMENPQLNSGTPLFFKGIEAGVIIKTEYNKKIESFFIDAVIYNDFSDLINQNTRFYKSGGIKLKADMSGVDFSVDNLKSLIIGKISFENLKNNFQDNYKNPKETYTLFSDREKAMKNGFFIKLDLKDSKDIFINRTKIIHKGLIIGEIKEIQPDENFERIICKAFINENARDLVRENSKFILKGPEIGINGVENLDSIFKGKFFSLEKGDGKLKNHFKINKISNDLKIILEADRSGSISKGSPIYYRQVKVGRVIDIDLKDTADKVLVKIEINEKYSPIVRKNTKFWYTGAIATEIGLTGIKIKTETLESLIKGGIEFATPDSGIKLNAAENGDVFPMYMKPKKKWLKWNPEIELNKD